MAELNEKNTGIERREKIPPFSVHIIYGRHATAEDADRITKRLGDADIYIPERSGWSPSFLYAMQDVSMGRKTPEEVVREQNINIDTRINPMAGFLFRELQILHNSKKNNLDHRSGVY